MIAQKIVLHFPPELVDQPIISNIVKKYGLDFNILRASIAPQKEGLLVLELRGPKEGLQKALAELKGLKIEIQNLSKDVQRAEEKCVHCGACVTLCPSDALSVHPSNWQIDFFSDRCVACELCVKGCPYGAMEVRF
jgi:ferredoxin